jgi:hypothetical protein
VARDSNWYDLIPGTDPSSSVLSSSVSRAPDLAGTCTDSVQVSQGLYCTDPVLVWTQVPLVTSEMYRSIHST